MKITSEHLEAARLMGACKSRLQAYQPGDDLSRVTVDDLIWIESRDKKLARKIADSSTHNTPAGVLWGKLPLWALGSGSGYGSG